MLFDNKHERLLTGSSVIDAWPLTRAVQDTMQVPHTHDRPLSQVYLFKPLTLCIPMDFPIQINAKGWDFPLYILRDHRSEFQNYDVI